MSSVDRRLSTNQGKMSLTLEARFPVNRFLDTRESLLELPFSMGTVKFGSSCLKTTFCLTLAGAYQPRFFTPEHSSKATYRVKAPRCSFCPTWSWLEYWREICSVFFLISFCCHDFPVYGYRIFFPPESKSIRCFLHTPGRVWTWAVPSIRVESYLFKNFLDPVKC